MGLLLGNLGNVSQPSVSIPCQSIKENYYMLHNRAKLEIFLLTERTLIVAALESTLSFRGRTNFSSSFSGRTISVCPGSLEFWDPAVAIAKAAAAEADEDLRCD